jgi:hypothetical protein
MIGARKMIFPAILKGRRAQLGGRKRLAETEDAVAFLPLGALLEKSDAFKTLEDVALLLAGRTACFETRML